MHKVLVLGEYGFFGNRITAALARKPHIDVLIAGRDGDNATAAARALGLAAASGQACDANDPALARRLAHLRIDTVIHTAGPFQKQHYTVARAAIEAGCNYIDLADSRDFVCGITALDEQARRRGVRVISVASSVPALSSAVVDRYRTQFARLDVIRLGVLRTIAPFAPSLNRASRWFEPLLSDAGAMFVTLEGQGRAQRPLRITWNLIARRNHGPHIPCGAAIALAGKFASGAGVPAGAMPCMGLLTVKEYLEPLRELDVHEIIE